MSALSRFPGLPRVLNPRLIRVAGKLPPLAVIEHRGRRSGREYRTPVQAFRTPTGFLVGLAYDADADWALNLLHSGHGALSRAGRRYAISRPTRRGPEAREDLPAPIALMMRTLGVDQFLAFDVTEVSE